MFGKAAAHFDKRVAALNVRWNVLHLENLELGERAIDPAPVEAEYRHERHLLEQQAQAAATLLRHPHRLDTVATLMDDGCIPLNALTHWPDLKKLVIKEVNEGKVIDPRIALSLPYTLYTKKGQQALAGWVHEHSEVVDSLVSQGAKVNLPPNPNGYRIRLAPIRTAELELSYLLSVAPGAGVTTLTFTGAKGGGPRLGGTVSDGNTTASLADDGNWSIDATAGDASFGAEMGPDGPWLVAHNEVTGHNDDLEETAKIRPPAPDPPEPWPARLAQRVREGVSDAEDDAEHVGNWVYEEFKHSPAPVKGVVIGGGLVFLGAVATGGVGPAALVFPAG